MHTFELPRPIDLLRSLSPLVASAQDPTIRLRADRLLRACWTPTGPVTLDVRALDARRCTAEAVGPGRDWALDHVWGLLGGEDELNGFEPGHHPLVARAHHRSPRLRLIRTGCIQDVLVPTILGQRVTSREAARSWTRIVRSWGHPAPGPAGLRLPPTARELVARPYWDYHRLGVERSRAVRILTACRALPQLQAALDAGTRQASAALAATPGVGPWTAALVLRSAAGDPDAVEIGDYHVPNHVAHVLAGEPRATDTRMLELLAPFAGHRGRVVRLLTSSAPRPPAYAARRRIVPVDAL